MDFGRVDNPDQVDFTLPADHPATGNILSGSKGRAKTKVYVGCAKWRRKDWLGKLYPKGTPEGNFLETYAKSFNSVELNATFHRIPSLENVKKWKDATGKNFRFCPKFPREISHASLPVNPAALSRFLKCLEVFGTHAGPCFFQFPPYFSPSRRKQLDQYIEAIKDFPGRIFFEFRHPDWFKGLKEAEEAFDMLAEKEYGLVITDTSGRRDCLYQRLTIPHAFIRFVGNHLHPSDFRRVDEWTDRARNWFGKGLQSFWFFIHNDSEETEIYSPQLAAYAAGRFRAIDPGIPAPDIGNEPGHGNSLLFYTG